MPVQQNISCWTDHDKCHARRRERRRARRPRDRLPAPRVRLRVRGARLHGDRGRRGVPEAAARVLHAVRLIKELKTENQQLQQQKDTLENQCEALKADHDRMSRELEEARSASATVERFEEKRRIIEEKVGGLLEKLDEIG